MACATNLATIAKVCGGGNAAGIKKTIYVVETSDIQTIPSATNHDISTDITMQTGKVFFKWAVSEQDQELKTVPEGDVDNIAYKTTLKAFIPRLKAATSNILNDVPGAELIVIATTKDGKNVLIGQLDDGALMKVEQSATGKNGYVITFEWTSSYIPYFYSGTIAV